MSRGVNGLRTQQRHRWLPYALTIAAGLGAALMLPRPTDAGESKSGVSPNVISLPSGPGSIEGLGDSFEPQLNSGAARYQVAVEVPPGRGGFTPEIVLQYNSGSPNGSFGLGWQMSIPFVQRQLEKGLPHYTLLPDGDGLDNDRDGVVDNYDEFDSIIYSNKEELVPVADHFWRLENESEFIRFRKVSDGWSGTRRDGVMLEFGRTGRSRVANGQRVFRWHLDRMVDPNGNVITFDYAKLDGSAQVYVKRVVYNETDETAMEVRFEHEPRPDVITDFRPRFELKTAYRCTKIAVLVGGEPVRSYKLSYSDASSWRPLSLLASITEIGRDGISSLPPVRFGYTGMDQATPMVQLIEQAPVIDLSDANVDLLDINSDGLPDIIDTNPQPHAYFLNEGVDHAGRVHWTGAARMGNGVGLFLGADEVRLADVNGDGRTDLVNLLARTAHYFTSTEAATWQSETPIRGASFRFNDPTVELQDLDHDKRIDVIQSAGRHLFAWINQGGGAWSGRYTWPHSDAQLQFERPTTHLADMNGDRLLDLVHVETGVLRYLPAMGLGEFGERVAFSNAPMHILDPARLTIVDVNGDGRGDVVHVGNPLVVWLNQGLEVGNHARAVLAPPFSIPAPLLNEFAAYREADVNGNGSRDILWNTRRQQLGFVDFSPGVQPNLLNSVDNGIGGSTRIHYSSSVSEMVGDAGAGRPWSQTIPFPVPVVSGMVVDDGLNSYRTEYAYRDGYYDAAEKEFRGFAEVTQTDVGDETIPDLVTSYLFDTGSSVEALKGKLLARKTRNPDDKVFFRERHVWGTRVLAGGGSSSDPRNVTYAFQSAKRLDVHEGGEASISASWDFEHDDFGNPTRVFEHGRLDSGWEDERITETTYTSSYSDGLDTWILNRVVQRTTLDPVGNRIAAERRYYDGSGALGAISAGNPTRVERWIEGSRWLDSERKDYDPFGNVTAIYDGEFRKRSAGHFREVHYDTEFTTYPVREVVHTGSVVVPRLEMRATYDNGFGTVTSHTDFSGNLTTYMYDPFARLIGIVKPGDSVAKPTVVNEYVLNFDAGAGARLNWVETRRREQADGGTVDWRLFYDGLGRKIMTREEDEESGRVIVTDTVRFNGRRLPWRQYLPYSETGTLDYKAPAAPRSAFTEHRYDALGRLTRLIQPDSSFSTIEYHPFSRIVRDEEQTRAGSPHAGAARRLVLDGLQDDKGLGRLREVHEIVKLTDDGRKSGASANWRTRYNHDLLDNLVLVEDAQGNRKRSAYDGLSRKVFDDDPNRGSMTYAYDDASNLRETVDAKQQRITYEYDGANRLVAENYHDEDAPFSANRNPDVRYVYDVPASAKELPDGRRTAPRNTRGRLVSVFDLSGETHRSYDARGRTEWWAKGIRHPQTGELVPYASLQSYDSLDRVTAFVYPDNDRITYSYNPRGLLEAVGSRGRFALSNLDYAPSGQLAHVHYGNGVSTAYEYDDRLRLNRLTTVDSAQSPLLSYVYRFDSASNIVKIDDRRPGIEALVHSPERVNDQSFDYDDLYRLVQVRYGYEVDSDAASVSYRYDRIGNLLEQSSNIIHWERGRDVAIPGQLEYLGGRSNRTGRSAGDPPGPHALTGASSYRLDYDNNGNVVRLNDMELTWDFKDRLVTVKSDLAAAEYVYDFTNQRVAKHVTYFNRDPPVESMVQYVDQHYEVRDGTPVKYVYTDQRRVARFIGSIAASSGANAPSPNPTVSARYYHQDHLGSTNVVTDEDGNPIEETAYYPFGHPRFSHRPSSVDQEPYKFSQKELDEESDLQYFAARYLHGQTARFLSVDGALGYHFTQPFDDPQRLNAYSYSLNRPLVYHDPSGEFAVVPMLIGGTTSVAVGYTIAKITGTSYSLKDFTVDFGTGAVGVGIVGKLEKLNRLRKLRKLAKDWGLKKSVKTTKGGRKFEYWTDATQGSYKQIAIKPPGTAGGLQKGSRISRASVRVDKGTFKDPFTGKIASYKEVGGKTISAKQTGVQHIPLNPLAHGSLSAKGQAAAIGGGIRGWSTVLQ